MSSLMNYLEIVVLLLLTVVLIKASDFVVISLRQIVRQTHFGVFAISTVIIAIGTSLPELFVSVTTAINNNPSLAFGVVLGSNIVNSAFIVGAVSLLAGKVLVHGEYVKRDVVIALIAGITPFVLILDKTLGRIDGFILLLLYGAYVAHFLKTKKHLIEKHHEQKIFVVRFIREFEHINGEITKDVMKLFLGLTVMLFSADLIVKTAENLALGIGMPVFLIGLILLAFGTSLPEVVFSFVSLKDHEPSMMFGNILGSTVCNALFILGITSIIRPISIGAISEYFAAVCTFVIVSLLLWLFIKSKHRLDRWEASILIAVYLIFVVLEFYLR